MITITEKKTAEGKYYDLTMVKKDTGSFKATPTVDDEPYEMQEGDRINFRVSKNANETPIVEIDADANRNIALTAEKSALLPVGDYFFDITLYRAAGNIDTFVRIPYLKGAPVSNFHVTYGV